MTTSMTRRAFCAALAAVPFGLSAIAHAQSDYPNRPIKLVVGYPPGGPVDITAREMGRVLSESLGQNVVVDNRPGASGLIGNEIVAKSAPDGYSLVAATSVMAIQETLFPKLPYDTAKDFTFVGSLVSAPLLLVVPNSLPVKSVQDLIALAKQKPGELSYASPSSGSANHLAAELLKTMAGIDLVHIPYKGGAPAETDLIAGRVAFTFATIASALPKVRQGQMRAIAVSSSHRSPIAPEIPTVAESGLPGFDAITWYGVLGPAGMPTDVTMRLNSAINSALQAPALKEKLISQGLEPMPGTPQQFVDFYKAESAKWGKVAKTSGAKLD